MRSFKSSIPADLRPSNRDHLNRDKFVTGTHRALYNSETL
jgi:hypothetical protein